MAVGLFDWYSHRSRLSRYGSNLRPWVLLFKILTFALFIGGVACLIITLPIGWVLLGLSAVPAMIGEWYDRELENVPINITQETIDSRMDSEILALLSKQPTPQELALALMKASGGMFFAVRFGVGGSFLKEVMSDNADDTNAIFKEALMISEDTSGRISPGVLILAMVRQIASWQALLGHLQLDEADLLRGVRWYHRIDENIKLIQGLSKQPGGIGRDWSFGWIPLLSRFGQNISIGAGLAHNEVRTEVMEQLYTMLSGDGGTVAMVGKDGVGKTELVYKLATNLIRPNAGVPKNLWYQQVFMLDASRILAEASERGELENLVGAILAEAFAAKNIIVCFDNAELFFEDGVGAVDLTPLLLPIIEAGRLKMILTIDEQKFLQISKRTPALAGALSRISVQPTDEIQTLNILEDILPGIEHRRGVTYMYQALKEAYKLSQRYVYDIEMPGQAVSLLEQAADYAESSQLVSASSVQRAIEQSTGIKAGISNDESEREKLLNLESLIHQRMIGQERAVQVVADALRRARSGVGNKNRPVGTFLFLGPTGVGKTELAKSLAEVYFGGEKNIVRLDMNEFVSPNDVARLIADGTTDPSSLTAQIMKQPFSVVLLDEIEKAHSSVLTTLLQLLDEGILRDASGREVSFRDSVVIATSNAGADRIREYLERGYSLEQFEQKFIDELISSHLFHPEFLNRFDEIVVFGPLDKPQLMQVVDLILVDVNKNLASQKITVTLTPGAKEYLVEAGYDPRLGARPMRRVVQRTVENLVAQMLLANNDLQGANIEINEDHVKAKLGANDGN